MNDTGSWGLPYSCGQYESRNTYSLYGYGKYTVRMKAAKGNGVVTGFFTYAHNGGDQDEIDIEFLGKNADTGMDQVQFNFFVNGVGGNEALYDLTFDPSEDFHTYGFEWSEDVITWYVDGAIAYVSPAGATLPTLPGKIIVNLWTPNPLDTGLIAWAGQLNYTRPLKAKFDRISYTAPPPAARRKPKVRSR